MGGKPRKPSKRGLGTDKTPVIGTVERNGNVVARVADDLTGKGVLTFVKDHLTLEGSVLITDEYGGYNAVHKSHEYHVINSAREYARDGGIHTNTIEGV